MSKFEEHRFEGALGGCIQRYLLRQSRREQFTMRDLIEAGILGAFGGVLPDVLEPPNGPDHRGFGHSYSTMCLTAAKYKSIMNDFTVDQRTKEIISSIYVGAIIHLLADSTTPRGLPPW